MRKAGMMKKLMAVFLCIAMAAGVCACGSGKDESVSKDTGTKADAKTGEDSGADSASNGENEDVVTIRAMVQTWGDGISTDDAIGRYIKDKLGIVIEYTDVTDDKLKVMAAGGDLPDLVELHNDAGVQMLDNLINSGALWAMDEWLENNGENLKAKIPDGLKFSKEVVGKGKTYFIPVEVQTMNEDIPNKNGFVGFFTRWDYYKELGCPEINNEDEYLEVLKQMMDAHPETEDGKKVYALSGWIDWGLWPYTISYPFSHGYGNQPNNQLYNKATDELEDMFTVEDGIFWKTLAFFNKAYRMGIMDPEAFTMKAAQYDAKLANGEVLVGAYGWIQPDPEVCGEDAGTFVLPGPFPYISQIYPNESRLGYGRNNSLIISANCEHPEKVMELLDFLNSDEGSRLVRTGIQGEDWDYVDGKPELIGKRLENFLSNDTTEPGYASPTGSQGIGKYVWFTSQTATNQAEDGYPLDLTLAKEYSVRSVNAAEKDFCDYYTNGEASYPGEAYVQLVNEGKMKTIGKGGMAVGLMGSVSDESAKVFTKADEYFQANIAKIITCADDEAFAAQKQKMIDDVMAMGYEKALEEVHEKFEEAKETAKVFE